MMRKVQENEGKCTFESIQVRENVRVRGQGSVESTVQRQRGEKGTHHAEDACECKRVTVRSRGARARVQAWHGMVEFCGGGLLAAGAPRSLFEWGQCP